jgi:hypothetical protein
MSLNLSEVLRREAPKCREYQQVLIDALISFTNVVCQGKAKKARTIPAITFL